MAGTITHAFFARKAIEKLKKKRKIIYQKELLLLFGQSMDPFNFYHILTPFVLKSHEKREFAGVFHHTYTDQFFETLIHYIRDHHLQNNVQVMSFLYGFITHYALDTALHPFVEYKCGRFQGKDPRSYRYNAKHHEMESYLDIYTLQTHHIDPHTYRAYRELFTFPPFEPALKDMLNSVFLQVYQVKNFERLYQRSIQDMKFCFRLLRYDQHGYKLKCFQIFDMLSTKHVLNSKFLSYYYIPKEKDRYLNHDHQVWHYPFDYSIQSSLSFDELYQNALNRCVELLTMVTDYLQGNKELNISSLFGLSYSSGLSWKKEKKNPKYEF